MINRDRLRLTVPGDGFVEGCRYRDSRHTLGGLQDRTPATPLIDDCEHPKSSTIHQRIMDEIHAPTLVRAAGRRRNTAMQAGVLATAQPMPQLQPFEPIQPPYALHVHVPAITPEQHVNAPVAEPR